MCWPTTGREIRSAAHRGESDLGCARRSAVGRLPFKKKELQHLAIWKRAKCVSRLQTRLPVAHTPLDFVRQFSFFSTAIIRQQTRNRQLFFLIRSFPRKESKFIHYFFVLIYLFNIQMRGFGLLAIISCVWILLVLLLSVEAVPLAGKTGTI